MKTHTPAQSYERYISSAKRKNTNFTIVVEALVDELIETKKVKESKLDERFSAKMQWAQEQLDKAKQDASIDYLKSQIFGNQMGEA